VQEQAAIMRDQVNWYLERARAAARAGSVGASTAVEPIVDGILRTAAKIHGDRAIVFDGEVAPDTLFRGERQDIEEMAGNLIDNAAKWARSKVDVTVEILDELDRPWLHIVIDDDGPGLPEDARAEMLKRGRRLDETKPGSGLGLSIVSDVAALYRGRLKLEASPPGGLRARLELPGDGG
jgi:signal transduction histidine kinase